MRFISCISTFSFLPILLVTTRGEATKLNVLFVVADDLRASLNCYGGPIISPNLDQLASQSAVFNNAYVQQAVCGPSRTSFLTGRRPDTTRLYDFGFYWRTFAGNYTTIPQHFKENGYFTASVGKVFHPGVASNGTDDYPYSWSIPAYHPSTDQYIFQKVCRDEDGSLHNNVVCPVNVSELPEQSLPDIQTADRALEILANLSAARKNKDSPSWDAPFFLGVGFRKPHLNWKYPEEYRDLYPVEEVEIAPNRQIPAKLPSVAWEDFFTARQRDDMKAMNLSFPYGLIPDDHHALMRQSYYAASTFVDYELGRVLKGLEEAGFANNTIISFVGDHGWQLGEHGEWCKYSNFEVATRVPLLVHVPQVTDTTRRKSTRKFPLQNPFKLAAKERGTRSKVFKIRKEESKSRRQLTGDIGVKVEEFVELVDLFPSLSELAGLKVPPVCPPQPFKVDFCAEGNSFAPLVRKANGKGLLGRGEFSRWKNATFSQYPRPGTTPSVYTDLPNLEIITVMGYSMLTEKYHYTEWVGFNGTTIEADWTDMKARELYIRAADPLEDNNVADETEYKTVVQGLSQKLQNGWRYSQPVKLDTNLDD